MRGSRIPEGDREAFRADFLYSGNASESARRVGINDRTARIFANELYKDPTFTEARRELRARALEEAERRLEEVGRVAMRRFKGRGPSIPEGVEGVTIVDKRPDYGKLVVDVHRSLSTRTKNDADIAKAAQPAPSDAPAINIFLADGTKVDRTEPAPTEPEKPEAKP
jgi:hypothetical protein